MASPYVLGAIALGSILIVGTSYGVGHRAGTTAQEAKMERAISEATAKAAAVQKAQDAISTAAAVKDAESKQKIETVFQTIEQRVPVYVQKSDHCPVSAQYVGLWNSAVGGADAIPTSTGKSDASAKGANAAH